MALKPSPRQAVIIQERIQEAIQDDRLPREEQELLRDFDTNLDRYLE
jgi:hypothetical protein